MAANTCPICSGEIMTYRRFLKEAEPSGISVCQCCGARLMRSRSAPILLVLTGLGAILLAVLLILLATRNAFPVWGTVVAILGLCVAFALMAAHLGWRLAGWVIVTEGILRQPMGSTRMRQEPSGALPKHVEHLAP